MSPLLPLAASFLVTIQLLCSAGVLYRIISSPNANHWALDVRLGWIICAITVGLAVVGLRKRIDPKWLFITTIAVTAAIALAILVTDQFNLLVHFERWHARGGPEPWEF